MKFLITCFLSLSLLAANGQATGLTNILHDFRERPSQVLVAAHRAPHAVYPENSLAAIREAIRLGVDIAELDVRQTKDGVLVLMHDKTITRTTGKPGGTQDYTYAELKQFPLLHNGQPTKERIPAFEDALLLAKGKIMVDIDFKADGMDAARQACDIVKRTGTTGQVLFFLYDYKEAAELRRHDAHIPIMPRAYSPADTDAILKMESFAAIHIDASFYSDTLVNRMRTAGSRVWINALGKYDKAEQETPGSGFAQLFSNFPAVNIIQTDLPEELIRYLRGKGLHR